MRAVPQPAAVPPARYLREWVWHTRRDTLVGSHLHLVEVLATGIKDYLIVPSKALEWLRELQKIRKERKEEQEKQVSLFVQREGGSYKAVEWIRTHI